MVHIWILVEILQSGSSFSDEMLAPKLFLDHFQRENKNYKQTIIILLWLVEVWEIHWRTSICNGPAFPSEEEINISTGSAKLLS